MERREVHSKSLLLASAMVLLVSCDDNQGFPEPITISDSAGVQLVEVSQEAWESAHRWVLSSSPDLSIGGREGPDSDLLFGVAAGSVLGDGRVVILSGGAKELLFYAQDGTLTGRQGREGEGPGEYRGPAGLWTLPGDSVVVWDWRLMRVTVVSPDGEVVRETGIPGQPMATQVRGAFSDGSLVLFQQRFAEEQRSMDQEFMGSYTRISPSANSLNPLGEFPWMRMITIPPGEVSGPTRNVESGPPIFDAETEVATTGSGVWVGTTKKDEILWVDELGDVGRILRWMGPNRSVTEDIENAYYEELRQRLAAMSPEGDAVEPPRDRPFADQLPSHGKLVARTDGGLWMQEFSLPGIGSENRWRIFGPEGSPSGQIQLPGNARVLWAAPDRVLLLERDELDVEYVRLYALGPGDDAR